MACGNTENKSSDPSSDPSEVTSELSNNLNEDPSCDGYDGIDIPGGTSYFVGSYTISGSDVSGEERWVILSNDTWEAMDDGGDCEVVWSMIGSTQDPTNCSACDFGVSVAANIDLSRTTCPEGLYTDDRQFQVSYSILRSESGDSTWFFNTSGEQFGVGSWSDTSMDFVTEGDCVFF